MERQLWERRKASEGRKTHSSRAQPIMVGRSWYQELEESGDIAFIVRKQMEISVIAHLAFSFFYIDQDSSLENGPILSYSVASQCNQSNQVKKTPQRRLTYSKSSLLGLSPRRFQVPSSSLSTLAIAEALHLQLETFRPFLPASGSMRRALKSVLNGAGSRQNSKTRQVCLWHLTTPSDPKDRRLASAAFT